jgi:enoyl-CoA hydratase
MTTQDVLLLEIRDGVAVMTVNRPDKLNALNAEVFSALEAALTRIETDAAIRGVIVTGAGGKAFVAGADIGEMAGQAPVGAEARARRGHAAFRRLERCGKPVVAAVNGFALGGGCELAMACHLRVASRTAKFGQPEVKLGIAPGYGGTVRLPRLVGRGRALDILLTARMVEADEALRIGLCDRVVEPDAVLAEAEALLRSIMAMGPVAVRQVLDAVDTGFAMGVDDALAAEATRFGLLAGTEDMREGMAAFLAKRPADFRGR